MKNRKEFSIKNRLTLSVVLLSICLILISFFFSFMTARHEIWEVYDARLGQSAKMLLLNTPAPQDGAKREEAQKVFDDWMDRIARQAGSSDAPTAFGHPYEQKILIQFYLNGNLIWGTQPDIGPVAHDPRYSGFGYLQINGETWRYFQLPLPYDFHSTPEYVIVAEKQSIRNEMIQEIGLSTALPQLILIPCLAVLIILLIDKNFEPITELKRAIAQRSINKLDSIYVTDPTQELSPLVKALNELLSELDLAWQREKRFTRMAAHELKTPLTILRLNTENALMSQNEEQLKSDLDNILKGIERTDRLIQQLLMLARVESMHMIQFSTINLTRLLRSVTGELVPFALKNGQDLSLEGEEVEIAGDEALLRVLFTNLLDNAIRYSGPGSQIEVKVEKVQERVEVRVSDTGVPISQETRDKLFDNFYRANTEKGDEAGLGMSITRDIAKLHFGEVELLPRSNDRNTFLIVLGQ